MIDFPQNRTLVMGILNATPDSFSDGGELSTSKLLNQRIEKLIKSGADILDIGGESTRPGHISIDAKTEIKRIMPVIQAVREYSKTIPISIDTQKVVVAKKALEAGANIINDISALSDAKMAQIAREYGCPIVLMRQHALSSNIISDCKTQFKSIVESALSQSIKPEQIILDPGLGFGDVAKNDYSVLPGGNVEANISLIKNIKKYNNGFPILIGASRKRFVGKFMGESDPKKRISGSVELAVLAAKSGAAIVRVHDVAETVIALKTLKGSQ